MGFNLIVARKSTYRFMLVETSNQSPVTGDQ